MLHHVKDLSPEQRRAIESLLGKRLSESDDISIRPLHAEPAAAPERRRELLAGLEAYFAQIDNQRAPVSDQDAADVMNEALRSVRPGYRPVK